MNIDERLEKLIERHEALASNVELLAASAHDLRVVVEAEVVRRRERDERDRKYLALIAEVAKHWADERGQR